MTPQDIIEAYVRDVVRRLPRRQRDDVGFELRALLEEELRGKAEEAGRAPDEAMTLQLLRAFGRPEEVAARYLPPRFALIEPALSRSFVLIAGAGVVLQWSLSFIRLAAQAETFDDVLRQLGGWWIHDGLGALWWPGFLLVCFAMGGWAQRRWPALGMWKPSTPASNRINRPGWIAALLFFVSGAAALIWAPVWVLEMFGPRVAQAFLYEPDFLNGRGLLVLPLWTAHFVLLGALIVRGQWTPLLRRVELLLSTAICALCAWYVAGGPIFQAKQTDSLAKGIVALIVFFSLIDVGMKLYRLQARIAAPTLPASPQA